MKRNIKQILFTFTLFIIQHALTTTNIIQSEYFIVLGRHLLLIEIPELNEMLYKTINQQTEYTYLPIDIDTPTASQLTSRSFTISFPNITTTLTINTFPSSQTYPIYPSGLSFIKSYSSFSKHFSLIHSLYNTNQISSLKYAFEPLNPNKGIFYIGDIPSSRIESKYKSTLLPYNITSPYWNSILNAISYTSITNEPLSYGHGSLINEEIIFNVGLPYIAVPPWYFQFIYKHVFHNAIKQIMIDNSLVLVQNPYGNYAIQIALDNWSDANEITYCFVNDIILLSLQKYSINVIEKWLEKNHDIFTKFIYDLRVYNQGNEIIKMLNNTFGNFVLIKALKLCINYNEFQFLRESIVIGLSKLNNKKLNNKWMKIFLEFSY